MFEAIYEQGMSTILLIMYMLKYIRARRTMEAFSRSAMTFCEPNLLAPGKLEAGYLAMATC